MGSTLEVESAKNKSRHMKKKPIVVVVANGDMGTIGTHCEFPGHNTSCGQRGGTQLGGRGTRSLMFTTPVIGVVVLCTYVSLRNVAIWVWFSHKPHEYGSRVSHFCWCGYTTIARYM